MEHYSITLDNVPNMDETGIMMGVLGRNLVVISRSMALQYMKQPGNKNWISVLGTISATGRVLPPFIIFKGAHHQSSWYSCPSPHDWRFAIFENGWTNDEFVLAWLQSHFEPLTRPQNNQYRLMLLDGHSSHCTWAFLNHCRLNRIVVLCLPAHINMPLNKNLDVVLPTLRSIGLSNSIRRYAVRLSTHGMSAWPGKT